MPGHGQAAYVALSQLLLRQGEQAAAADILEELYTAQRAGGSWEPWWAYPFGEPPRGFEMIIDLRAEVQR
jgi:hypothetical protein